MDVISFNKEVGTSCKLANNQELQKITFYTKIYYKNTNC